MPRKERRVWHVQGTAPDAAQRPLTLKISVSRLEVHARRAEDNKAEPVAKILLAGPNSLHEDGGTVTVLSGDNTVWRFTEFTDTADLNDFVERAGAVAGALRTPPDSELVTVSPLRELLRLEATIASTEGSAVLVQVVLTPTELKLEHDAGNLPRAVDLIQEGAITLAPGLQPWELVLRSLVWSGQGWSGRYVLSLTNRATADSDRPRFINLVGQVVRAAPAREARAREEANRQERFAALGRAAPPAPRLIRAARDAEEAAADWLGWWDGEPGRTTPVGADGGIDVFTSQSVGQVKRGAVPTGRPALQQLYGVAVAQSKRPVFFALAGYTAQAAAWADEVGMPLFQFDLQGLPSPLNQAGHRLNDG